MVRFCDKDVISLNYDGINRQELLRYLLRGHIDDIVCVFGEDNEFMGTITYYSLRHNENIDEAIDRDILVLNEDIWTYAEEMFENHKLYLNKYPLLPVVDKAGQLISFAYKENDANRELRQLRELTEKPDALQFGDIYPEYDCVIIYGFNELAYFFARYLKAQGIPVRLEDVMWEGFLESDETPFMEHRSMKIYAEGTWAKPSDWEENLLRSVSVEFECIDAVYEENIRREYIKNSVCSLEKLLEKLKNAEAVAVMGKDIDAQDAYDFLAQNGIDVNCFVMFDKAVSGQRLFGKPLCTLTDVKKKYGNNIVLIDNHWENSAWGIGKVDYLDYIGYRRNEGMFLLKDYIKIRGNGLKAALKDKKIVMTGDILLCERLQQYFGKHHVTDPENISYINLTDEKMPKKHALTIANVDRIDKDAVCLVVLPEYVEVRNLDQYGKYWRRKAGVISSLRENRLMNYTDYFSFMETFIDIEKENDDKYPDGRWKVKRIALGSIETCSGNIFFDGLLDNHPFIMTVSQRHWSVNIFWLCVWLADRTAEDIVQLLEDMRCSQYDIWGLAGDETFLEKMKENLRRDVRYTSQELFVIIHAILCGKSAQNISDMIIFWESHWRHRYVVEKCALWLGADKCPCDIVNVVRNAYIARGSNIKGYLEFHWGMSKRCYQIVTGFKDIYKEKYDNSNRIITRFEDLKCNPVEELNRICKELDIPWSDTLMEVTQDGEKRVYDNGRKEVKDFDLTPVYNLYEEYFSEFDRFRIALICAPWQKMHGYPYADISLFSRRELQEMFLKDFRFTNRIGCDKVFVDKRDRREFFIELQADIRQVFQRVRMHKLGEN